MRSMLLDGLVVGRGMCGGDDGYANVNAISQRVGDVLVFGI